MPELSFEAGPENGIETQSKKPKRLKRAYGYVSMRVASVVWIGIDAYALYAFCYDILWKHVRYKNKGAAIAILCLFCSLNFYAVVTWCAIHLWGPGKVSEKYRNPGGNDDAAFLCDENGYSLYCSTCKHIKPNRTHHSSFTNTCVPVMDHYCPWLGSVIGQGNRKFFLQFLVVIFMSLLLILITLFIYQHQTLPHINGNSIALYILCGIAWVFSFVVLVQHFVYLLLSHSTIEHMNYRSGGPPYINMLMDTGVRHVVQPNIANIIIPKPSPFNLGAWKNITNVMGPVYTWLLPIRGPIYEPMIADAVLKDLETAYKAVKQVETEEEKP